VEDGPIPTTGDHKGPPNPPSTTLAPTDRPASCLTSQLKLMRITADLSAVVIIHAFPNAPLRNQTTTKRPKTSPN